MTIRKGFAGIGYGLFGIWELALLATVIYAFSVLPLAVPTDPHQMPAAQYYLHLLMFGWKVNATQCYLLMIALIVAVPLAVRLVWRLLLWPFSRMSA